MSGVHSVSMTTAVLHQLLLTYKQSPPPSGSPKPSNSRSDWRSCCLSHVSIKAVRQAFLYSDRNLSFPSRLSDCHPRYTETVCWQGRLRETGSSDGLFRCSPLPLSLLPYSFGPGCPAPTPHERTKLNELRGESCRVIHTQQKISTATTSGSAS